MKFSFKIALLICLGFISFEINAQQNSATLTVNNPAPNSVNTINNQDDVARDEVHLIPFSGGEVHLTPQSSTDEVHLHIDPTLVVPISYQSSNGTSSGGQSGTSSSNTPISRNLNTNLAVGSTTGSYNINQYGGLGYAIPITLPPGTNGIVPSISINYNSFGGNNLLGYGWGLRGISSIDRNKMDFYHNVANSQGYQIPLNFTNSDLLTLDGNALTILTGPTTAPALYSTENDLSIRVTPVYSSGAPTSFVVQTKDGLTMEYGNTTDSRFIPNGQTNVLSWKVNKISDNYGNYILFQYHNQNGEIYIEKILYTGNTAANITPYNEIDFYYDSRSDKNSSFVQGGEVDKTVILNKIVVGSQGQMVKTFEFNYTENNYQSFLNEIIESGAQGDKYNSMLFSYMSDEVSHPKVSYVPLNSEIYRHESPDSTHQYKHVALDFNGDGNTDIMRVSGSFHSHFGNFIWTDWDLLQNDGTGNFTRVVDYGNAITSFVSQQDFSMLNMEIDGDGKEDMIFLTSNEIVGGGVIGVGVWLSQNNPLANTGGTLLPYSLTTDADRSNTTQNALFLDYNGDGKMDLPNPYKSSSGNTTLTLYDNLANISNPSSVTQSFNTYYDFSNATALDIDGDGKQELVNIKNGTNSYILIQQFGANSPNGFLFIQDNSGYNYNPFNFSPEFSGGYPAPIPDSPYDFYGDFNGDAKSDVLNFMPNLTTGSGGNWTLNIGKGDGTYQSSTPTASLPTDPYNTSMTNPIVVMDANADGKTDVLSFENNGIETSASYSAFYSRQRAENKKPPYSPN